MSFFKIGISTPKARRLNSFPIGKSGIGLFLRDIREANSSNQASIKPTTISKRDPYTSLEPSGGRC